MYIVMDWNGVTIPVTHFYWTPFPVDEREVIDLRKPTSGDFSCMIDVVANPDGANALVNFIYKQKDDALKKGTGSVRLYSGTEETRRGKQIQEFAFKYAYAITFKFETRTIVDDNVPSSLYIVARIRVGQMTVSPNLVFDDEDLQFEIFPYGG